VFLTPASGTFDLDPNRVFDVVLDAYECHLSNPNYLRLLSIFNRDFLPDILGFKYKHYQRVDPPEELPLSLTRLSAQMVREGWMTVAQLEPHVPEAQRVNLVTAFVEVGALDAAMSVLERYGIAEPCEHAPLARALCDQLHAVIEPLYRKYVLAAFALICVVHCLYCG